LRLAFRTQCPFSGAGTRSELGLESGEHWFDLEPADGATVVGHTIEGSAAGRYEAIWRERVEPLHDRILEALLDNVEAAAVSRD
jgi:hypothetical protein